MDIDPDSGSLRKSTEILLLILGLQLLYTKTKHDGFNELGLGQLRENRLDIWVQIMTDKNIGITP